MILRSSDHIMHIVRQASEVILQSLYCSANQFSKPVIVRVQICEVFSSTTQGRECL